MTYSYVHIGRINCARTLRFSLLVHQQSILKVAGHQPAGLKLMLKILIRSRILLNNNKCLSHVYKFFFSSFDPTGR